MTDILSCCKITDVSENIEILPELLAGMGLDFSTWATPERNLAVHTIYCAGEKEAAELREKLRSLTEEWRSLDINVSEITTASIKKEDWAEFWKIHFKTLRISDRLIVKPSWDRTPVSPGQAVVELDPGMSFGTGHHPTTSFCLKMIDELAPAGTKKSLLDAGCGSGILSIAAEKLGFKDIEAFDIDPDAVRVAKENLEKNGCSEAVKISVSGLEEFVPGRQFDVVAANILSSILIKSRDKILSLLKNNGRLILAGILNEEYERVKEAFEAAACREVKNFSENEWKSGLFYKR